MMFNMLRDKVGDAQFIRAPAGVLSRQSLSGGVLDDIRKSFRGRFKPRPAAVLRPVDKGCRNAGRNSTRRKLVAPASTHAVSGAARASLHPGRSIVIETDKGVETRTVSMPSDKARVE